jgi:hypothetical protein
MNLTQGSEPLSTILGSPLTQERKLALGDLFSASVRDAPRVHLTYRLDSEKSQLPYVIIPAGFDVEEFFASVATFYANQSPLSAYVHILGKDLANCFSQVQSTIIPVGGDMPREQRALLGAAIGETALAALNNIDGPLNTSYSACKRSLGYTLARARALYPELKLNLVVERWQRLRKLTGLAISPSALQALKVTHVVVSGLAPSNTESIFPAEFQMALATFVRAADTDKELERKIFNMYPGVSTMALELKGPFDARMIAFTKVVEEIRNTTHGPEIDSVAVAYFCNQILPASFAHGRVLARLVDFFPTALIWYGFFSCTSNIFDVRNFGNGLFQKLWRDISQPFSFTQRPVSDVSLDEFEVLARASVKADAIKPTQQKIATVALLPGLDIFTRFVADDDTPSVREVTPVSDIPDPQLSRVTLLLEEATTLLRDLGGGHVGRSQPISGAKRSRKKL